MKTKRDYTPGKPSVTTIISKHLGWKGPGLIQWAHKLGKEGRSLSERDEAAAKGSCAHDLVAAHFAPEEHGDTSEWRNDQIEEAKPNANRVIDLVRSRSWEPIAVELAMESERFAGTLDLCVRDADRQVMIVDLKTSRTSAGSSEWVIQLGAYSWLWRMECARRNTPEDIATEAAIIHAPYGSDIAVFNVSAAALAAGEQAFRLLLDLHDITPQIKAT